MKAITIWQPWASLIAVGAKKFETRPWATNYRGPIAIHAAKNSVSVVMQNLFPRGMQLYSDDFYEKIKYEALLRKALNPPRGRSIYNLPTGCIVATAELVECWEIRVIDEDAEALFKKHHPMIVDNRFVNLKDEIMFGNFTKGRFAWELANVQIFDSPIPARGKQGLWDWEKPM